MSLERADDVGVISGPGLEALEDRLPRRRRLTLRKMTVLVLRYRSASVSKSSM